MARSRSHHAPVSDASASASVASVSERTWAQSERASATLSLERSGGARVLFGKKKKKKKKKKKTKFLCSSSSLALTSPSISRVCVCLSVVPKKDFRVGHKLRTFAGDRHGALVRSVALQTALEQLAFFQVLVVALELSRNLSFGGGVRERERERRRRRRLLGRSATCDFFYTRRVLA